MQVYESIQSAELNGPTFLTIGNFDGIHRGHRALIADMCKAAAAESASCGLLTFHPHPSTVLRPDFPTPSLTSLQERLALYPATGLDFAIIHPFTRSTAQTDADTFARMLHSHLAITQLWVGPDFALGRNRQGDVSFLQNVGKELGFEVIVYPEYEWEGQPVRASRIRRLIEQGNLEWANNWLGRFYAIPGIVVHGAMRGRTIGFPTANLSVPQGQVIPASGVYATWAMLGGRCFPSVTNIGTRPTVNGSHRTIEAHIIDFDGNVYGRHLRLEFVARLRDEMKFPGLDALTAQIGRDRDRAAAMLATRPRIVDYPRFEELSHTADWAIRAYGEDEISLFANAALAMFALQGAADADGPAVEHAVEVNGEDQEDLLVRWLSELLWLAETEGALFQRFWIEQLDTTHLKALVSGRLGRSDAAHIKAVTYNDLAIIAPEEKSNLWQALVVFDV
ncbi:MAG: bifunctional riboflavin kinase/FAD synthetase [Caldilineales bacterium]|nr:bifunctional riboflavin kinase/FAD synthetase [Caldilineales bacterium]